MYTNGFVIIASDAGVIDTPFSASINGTIQNVVAGYVSASGTGDIIWRNAYGDLNWLPGAVAGMLYVIGATEIVSAGTVNGIARVSTATGITWFAINAQSKF